LAVSLAASLASAGAIGGCKKRRMDRAGEDPGRPAPAVGFDAGAARRDETALLTQVEIRRVDPDRPLELDDEELARIFGAALTEDQVFAGREEDVPEGRVPVRARAVARVSYDLVGDASQARSIVCAVEAEIEWQGGGDRVELHENVLVERRLAPGDDPRLAPAVGEMLARALAEAGAGLAGKERLRQGPDADVIAALDASDPDRVSFALELMAERRLRGGFDRAVALLRSEHPSQRAAALRALVALGDARAVEHLAGRADFGDHQGLRTIIEAVSAIGGEEAGDFLELVATGHPDPEIRKHAAEGLERIRRARAAR
jgi:hypothetical protein